MAKFRYPCMGRIKTEGFGAFLDRNLGASRHNIIEFGKELGALFGAEHITMTNSGSAANLVAALTLAETLRAEGRPLEAVTAAYTFSTTFSAMMMAGFSVRVIDTEEGGLNMCPQALERAMAEKPATLVCVTHLLGFPADMDRLLPVIRKHKALLLQDACETQDLRDKAGKPMHAHGDLSTWSFYHPHHISSYGGGAIVAKDAALNAVCDSISHWGRACTCHIDPKTCKAPPGYRHNFTYLRPGVNAEMSELNACFGRFQTRDWAETEKRRKLHYDILYQGLKGLDAFRVWPAPENNGSPCNFPLSCRGGLDLHETLERLAKHGVEARNLMGGTMTDQPAFKNLPGDGCKNARATAARSFFVGIHQTLPTDDLRAVADIFVREFGEEKVAKAVV